MIRDMTTNQLILCIFVIMIISSLMFWNKRKELKPLENTLFEFTGYRFSHFLLYMVAGYFFPEKWLLFLVAGIIWEILESIYRQIQNDKWWGGPKDYVVDIIVNMAGFFTGAYLTG